MRNTLVATFLEEARKNPNLVFLTGDLGFNVLECIQNELPNQFFNCGISEQNMASVAAGLALSGKCVFMYSIGNFSSLRCVEQIRNDIAYHNANVIIVALAAGFAYGPLGMSHHSTEDIACMRCLPNMTVFSPCDPIETVKVTRAAMRINGPAFIRLGRGGEPTLWESFDSFTVGKAYKMFDGGNDVIFSTGAITAEAIKAVKELKSRGIDVALYTFPTIKPIDVETITNCAKKYQRIITLEEHQINGGLAGSVAEVLAEIPGNKAVLKRIGMRDVFTSAVGSTAYLREYYGLDSKAIIKVIEEK